MKWNKPGRDALEVKHKGADLTVDVDGDQIIGVYIWVEPWCEYLDVLPHLDDGDLEALWVDVEDEMEAERERGLEE